MRKLLLLSAFLLILLLAGCAQPAPTPTPTPKPTPAPTATPTPTPPPPVISVKLDVAVGAPPSEGWKWVVAELNTGADEAKEGPHDHGFFWIFFAIKGSTEVSTADGTKVASAGEGIMIPAKQQHSHRYLPQSKVLVFDVRSANDNPDRFHGATKLLVSDKLEMKAGSAYKLRIREFTLPPRSRTSEDLTSDPNFVYVVEGTLTTRAGSNVSTTEAGKVFTLPLNVKPVASNEGTTPLRFVLVDVRP